MRGLVRLQIMYCRMLFLTFVLSREYINLQVEKKMTVQSQVQPLTREVWGGNQLEAPTVIQRNTECYQVARGPTQGIHQSSHVNELEIQDNLWLVNHWFPLLRPY